MSGQYLLQPSSNHPTSWQPSLELSFLEDPQPTTRCWFKNRINPRWLPCSMSRLLLPAALVMLSSAMELCCGTIRVAEALPSSTLFHSWSDTWNEDVWTKLGGKKSMWSTMTFHPGLVQAKWAKMGKFQPPSQCCWLHLCVKKWSKALGPMWPDILSIYIYSRWLQVAGQSLNSVVNPGHYFEYYWYLILYI